MSNSSERSTQSTSFKHAGTSPDMASGQAPSVLSSHSILDFYQDDINRTSSVAPSSTASVTSSSRLSYPTTKRARTVTPCRSRLGKNRAGMRPDVLVPAFRSLTKDVATLKTPVMTRLPPSTRTFSGLQSSVPSSCSSRPPTASASAPKIRSTSSKASVPSSSNKHLLLGDSKTLTRPRPTASEDDDRPAPFYVPTPSSTTGRSHRPATRAGMQRLLAVAEGRGTPAEVGMCLLHVDTGECALSQVTDSQTYARTLHKIHLNDPMKVMYV